MSARVETSAPRRQRFTTFPNDAGYNQMVLVRDIQFRSLCEHHMLPFHGIAHVGYLTSERIVGLSRLARVVERFACGLQVQERMTRQIVDCLDSHLRPEEVGVVLEAEHQCMSVRGIRAHGSRTLTSELTREGRRAARVAK